VTELLGAETPRLASPDPVSRWMRRNTLGFACIEFARDFLGQELLPWQRHAVMRILAVDDAGNFRFRIVLILVGRQSGKSTLLKIITLFLMYLGSPTHGPVRLVLGAAQDLKIARELWNGAVDLAHADDELRAEVEFVRRTNGEQELKIANGSRYMITATSRGAGRGLSVDLLNFDELREQRDWDAWNALTSTTIARPNSLILAASNAGDDESVVLNQLRDSALAGADPGVCIMEWSAPDGAALDDEQAWAQGCPGLGHTVPLSALRGLRATMTAAGFRTEIMCQRVDQLDALVTPETWRAGEDPASTFAGGPRPFLCLDGSPDLEHVTLTAAAKLAGDRVRLGVVDAWESTPAALAGLAAHLEAARPVALGWFPSGPMAAIGPDLAAVCKLARVRLVELKGPDVAAACQALVELATSRRLVHAGDPLLTAHVTGATKTPGADGYRFTRKGGRVDAAYAAAGAVQLARTTRSVGKPRLITAAA
jgi:hypothetical protein